MDAAMLKTFPRKKIQDLAKVTYSTPSEFLHVLILYYATQKYGVKANLKTDSIIALLMKKHPNGVPRLVSPPLISRVPLTLWSCPVVNHSLPGKARPI